MYYVFNTGGIFQSAHIVKADARKECEQRNASSFYSGWYYVTRDDANNTQLAQIKAYEMRCEEAAERETELTLIKNEHYRILNDRFHMREKQLRILGFTRLIIEEHNMVVYTLVRFRKRMSIPAATLSNADEIVWADRLEECKRFVA